MMATAGEGRRWTEDRSIQEGEKKITPNMHTCAKIISFLSIRVPPIDSKSLGNFSFYPRLFQLLIPLWYTHHLRFLIDWRRVWKACFPFHVVMTSAVVAVSLEYAIWERERCRGKVAEKRRERKKEKCVRERTGIRSANKSIIFFL